MVTINLYNNEPFLYSRLAFIQTVDEIAADFPEINGQQVLAFFSQTIRKFSKVSRNDTTANMIIPSHTLLVLPRASRRISR